MSVLLSMCGCRPWLNALHKPLFETRLMTHHLSIVTCSFLWFFWVFQWEWNRLCGWDADTVAVTVKNPRNKRLVYVRANLRGKMHLVKSTLLYPVINWSGDLAINYTFYHRLRKFQYFDQFPAGTTTTTTTTLINNYHNYYCNNKYSETCLR